MFLFLFWLLLAAFFALSASAAAQGKGHEPVGWAFWGLIFGPFAMLAVIGLPDLKTRKILRSIAEAQGVDLQSDDLQSQDKKWKWN